MRSLGRSAVVALVGALALLPAEAHARDRTWCVGGYDGQPPHSVDACGQPEIEAQHLLWHFHTYVTDGTRCWACYDERDNSCVDDFLRAYPSFRRASPYQCLRGAQHESVGVILDHVIEGQKATPPPPPTPAKKLDARVEQVGAGPVAAGDKIELVGAVRDDKGAVRAVPGGTFVIETASGETLKVRGAPQRDGTVRATATLPATESVKISFEPDAPRLGPGEVLAAPRSSPVPLAVSACALRAKIVAPTPGEALASGQQITLRAALFEGASFSPATTPPDLSLSFSVQIGAAPPQTVAAAGLEAPLTLPQIKGDTTVRIVAGGRAGARAVCPAGPVELPLSDLGLAFDTSSLPRTCYVGLPCAGEIRLLRPAQGDARARVDALLSQQGAEVVTVVDGAVVAKGKPATSDVYRIERRHDDIGTTSWSLEVRAPGAQVKMRPHDVRIRPRLELSLPAELDFGVVPAGRSFDANCKKLSFAASTAAEEHGFSIEVIGDARCIAHPVLGFSSPTGRTESRPLRPAVLVDAIDPVDQTISICLDTPRCDGEVSPDGVQLVVTPRTREFASQRAVVGLRWRVVGRSFLACHAFWLGPLGAIVSALLVFFGITRPARFRPAATIKVAGSEKGLRRASTVTLQSFPGSGSGFFRDAALGLFGDGDVRRSLRGAVVVLRASRGPGLVIVARAPLERQDRRTMAYERVDDGERGHVPSVGATYRCGGTYFQVDPG